MKRLRPKLVYIVFLLLCLEGAAYSVVAILRINKKLANAQSFTVDASTLSALKKHYDVDLGWRAKHASPSGERPIPKHYGSAFLTAFGDSFVFGSEVNDSETWAQRLGELVNRDVLNLGVEGYGPDQSYLRFQRDFSAKKTPIVVLGVITENIVRVVNTYRAFLTDYTPLTKPRFLLKEGKLALVKNPIANEAELVRLTDPQFIESLGQNDDWFQSRARSLGNPHFPYSKFLLSANLWSQLKNAVLTKISFRPPHYWNEVWQNAESRELFFAILEAFFREAKSQGAAPILVLFPRKDEVEQKRKGSDPEFARLILERCEAKNLKCFDGISALALSEDTLNSLYRPAKHLSPQGNRRLADAFFIYLNEQHIL